MDYGSISYADINSNIQSVESSDKIEKWIVENPELPFWRCFTEPLIPNSALIITGKGKENGHMFTVNFLLDLKTDSDLGFHFNPRFNQCVICNTRFDGHWDIEEAFEKSGGGAPFSRGSEFRLDIFFTPFEFLVAVNRDHFCRFGYRASLNELSRLEIFGDIFVYSVELTCKDHYPPSAIHANPTVHDRLRVPYWRYFIDPIIPSTRIHIRGTLPEKGKSFILNLYTSWDMPSPDIALHLRPKLADGYLACNDRREGTWGEEEPNAWGRLPFTPGRAFALDILIEEKHFCVSVNHVNLCQFKHRITPVAIKYMAILKDIILKRVDIVKDSPLVPLSTLHSTAPLIYHSLDLPFHRDVLDPIVPKTDLIICGFVNKDAIRFSVNLLDSNGDVVLHLNPRFDQNYVARNHRQSGDWGTEESLASSRNPFARGQYFALEIFATRSEFLIGVNGLHFCSFTYRLPLADVKSVEIDGDIKLTKVELNTKDWFPSIPLPELKLSDVQGGLETPIVYQLKEPVRVGTEVVLKGRVKLLPWSFHFNLQDSAHHWPHPQIGFHMSVRLAGEPSPIVVFNSWVRNSWGSEERVAAGSAFSPGTDFELSIVRSEGGWLVSAPAHLTSFRPPPPSLSLDTLVIRGDIVVNTLRVIG